MIGFVRCWGCGHIGPADQPEGLCPSCCGDSEPVAAVRIAEASAAVPPSDLEETPAFGMGPVGWKAEPDLGPLFCEGRS